MAEQPCGAVVAVVFIGVMVALIIAAGIAALVLLT